LWDEFTDFSITVYDSTGEQIPGGNEAVNYAFGRLSFGLPEKFAGQRLTVEFYPAFAKLPGHAWSGSARIRFLGKEKPLGNGSDLSVVAGGRAAVPLPLAPPSALELPDGFGPLIETRVGAVAAIALLDPELVVAELLRRPCGRQQLRQRPLRRLEDADPQRRVHAVSKLAIGSPSTL